MSWFSEKASAAIRDAGGRMTEQRRLIIDVLENSHGQLDVEALYDLAHQTDPSLSIATVYRTLSILEAANLVQGHYHSRYHERRYYERLSSAQEYHFTCRACRKVIPFHADLVLELEQRLAAQLGVVVLGACICLDGLCPDCRDKALSSLDFSIPIRQRNQENEER